MSQLFTSGGQSIGVSACISPSNEYLGLISLKIDWFDLLAVLGTLKEKAGATHSITLAWRIPWTEEPGGLQSMGLQRVRHD